MKVNALAVLHALELAQWKPLRWLATKLKSKKMFASTAVLALALAQQKLSLHNLVFKKKSNFLK